MKALRTLLLGSAGAAMLFAAATAAQAASPPGEPMAEKGRTPVWRCDTAGFIEYPGSDLCFKIGGKVAAWLGFTEDNVDTDDEGFNPTDIWEDAYHSDHDTFFMGALARFNIDVRNASEYGVIRAFMEFEASDGNGNTGGAPGLRHAFVQIGNWLMGKTWSLFSGARATPELFTDPISLPGDGPIRRVVQLRYTFKASNGVTVAVAIEDPARWNGGFIDNIWGMHDSRNEIPAVVGSINVKGSWGEVNAAVHAMQYSWHGGFPGNSSDREVGWAALLSMALNVPGTMGDVIYLQTVFADGNNRPTENLVGATYGTTAAGTYDSVTTWSVVGGYEHYWSKTVRSSIGASYVEVDYNNIFLTGTNDDSVLSVWGNVVWTLAKGLDLGVEVVWAQRDVCVLAAGACASTTDYDAFGFAAEVIRAF